MTHYMSLKSNRLCIMFKIIAFYKQRGSPAYVWELTLYSQLETTCMIALFHHEWRSWSIKLLLPTHLFYWYTFAKTVKGAVIHMCLGYRLCIFLRLYDCTANFGTVLAMWLFIYFLLLFFSLHFPTPLIQLSIYLNSYYMN